MSGRKGAEDHGWRGGARFRVGRLDGRLVVRFAGVSTRGGRLADEIGGFFRKNYKGLRPTFEPYTVRIWIEHAGAPRRFDADNVAKACLDALTGVVWKDDSQVVELTVEKIDARADAITVAAAPCRRRRGSPALDALVQGLDALTAPSEGRARR